MAAIDCEVVKKGEMDKLRGKVERLERDRMVLFGLFVVTAVALGYVLANVPV